MAKAKRGRPPVPIGDIFIAACLATYFNRPSRKAVGITHPIAEWLFERGKAPAAITLRFAMKTERLTKCLLEALRLTSSAVRSFETKFAMDSSYYKTPNYGILAQRRGSDTIILEKIRNAKMHIAISLETLMVVAVETSDGEESDLSYFMPLLEQINGRFLIDEILADAGYYQPSHFEAVKERGGVAFIDQKVNAKENGSPHHDEMVRLRKKNFDDWFDGYRYRPLVECSNSSMKRTIKRVIRARLERSRQNELLLICVVYNLMRLMEARIERGIDIPWASEEALQLIDNVVAPRKAA